MRETLSHRAFHDDRDARSRVLVPAEPPPRRKHDLTDREHADAELAAARGAGINCRRRHNF
jgi:hypothetical protein